MDGDSLWYRRNNVTLEILIMIVFAIVLGFFGALVFTLWIVTYAVRKELNPIGEIGKHKGFKIPRRQ